MRIVANLLCESEWAGGDAPRRLLQRVSALGTLVGALGHQGDELWTPLLVAPGRVVPAPGLPVLGLCSGPLDALTPAPTLAWGETLATARARPAECALRAAPTSGHWLDVLRSTRPPTPQTQKRVCDRRRQLAFARDADLALADAVIAETVDAVLASPAAARGDRWVAKAPWSAAGRDRLRGRGSALPDADRTRLRRLLDTYGGLVVEPWLERTDDFGGIGLVVGGTVRIIGFHRVLMTGGGAWCGIRPLGAEPAPDGLDDAEAAALTNALRRAGAWLGDEGYQGAFGIDAWRHRDADAPTRFHAVGELNARLTFGSVARRLAESAGWDPHGDECAPALRVGSGSALEAAGRSAQVLLQPGGDDGVAAWLQCAESRSI